MWKPNWISVECVETCPHCDNINIYPDYDPIANNYIAVCQECGERIQLCDECMHAHDNKEGFCDWHISRRSKNYEVGKCFRGVTFNKRFAEAL